MARAGLRKHVGRLKGRMVRPMKIPTSHGPRPGPAHQIFRSWAAACPGPPNFSARGPLPGLAHQSIQSTGRDPTRSIKFSEHGSRHGPAKHMFNFLRPGPARSITLRKNSARPGPSNIRTVRPGPAGPWHLQNSWPNPARPGPGQRPMTSLEQ